MATRFTLMSRQMLRKLKPAALMTCGVYATYWGYTYYMTDTRFYQKVLLPFVHRLDPEMAHSLALTVVKSGIVVKPRFKDPPTLKTNLWNMDFDNPIGLAAGFDKDGEAIRGLRKLGFGFVEIGSVTPKPQVGNPKPRLFRLPRDKAIINRYGFNSDGHDMVFERLQFLTRTDISKRGIVGVNLGKNKDSVDSIEDYVQGVKKFGGVADYLVINISSPNTTGLRILQRRKELCKVIDKVLETRNKLHLKRKPPVLIKLAPDLSEEDKKDIAAVLMRKAKPRVDGIIISNSTISRPSTLKSKYQYEDGGLTGEPLKKMATETIRSMYSLTRGEICIIGVGGVATGADAYEKIRAGASLVQIYTALVYKGFPVVTEVKRELSELLKKDGFKSVSDAVGADHDKFRRPF